MTAADSRVFPTYCCIPPSFSFLAMICPVIWRKLKKEKDTNRMMGIIHILSAAPQTLEMRYGAGIIACVVCLCEERARLARSEEVENMIRKLKDGRYRLYSRKVDKKTGKRRNLGTFNSRKAAEKHEREVQYFKRR
jgi:hypothetical protein